MSASEKPISSKLLTFKRSFLFPTAYWCTFCISQNLHFWSPYSNAGEKSLQLAEMTATCGRNVIHARQDLHLAVTSTDGETLNFTTNWSIKGSLWWTEGFTEDIRRVSFKFPQNSNHRLVFRNVCHLPLPSPAFPPLLVRHPNILQVVEGSFCIFLWHLWDKFKLAEMQVDLLSEDKESFTLRHKMELFFLSNVMKVIVHLQTFFFILIVKVRSW